MSLVTAATIIFEALKEAIPVNPWLGALWLFSALALAALLVLAWQRLLQR